MTQPELSKKGALHNEADSSPAESVFEDVIFRYTRAQAIEDGVLIDVTDTARECGFRLPVALSAGAWADCITVHPKAEGQDEMGRLWDVLNVLRFAIQGRQGQPSNRVDFKVYIQQSAGHGEDIALYALCGPGDDAEPVITVMLPNED